MSFIQEVNGIDKPAGVRETLHFIKNNPDFVSDYKELRRNARIMNNSAFYEITSKCNLRCEGCYYFDGGYDHNKEETSLDKWDNFFANEHERGVRFVYMVGAEPSLAPDRLAAASSHFNFGLIGTNGIARIDSSIKFKIHLSVWGDSDTDSMLRGAPAFEKALRNYQGEERVLVLFTLSPKNLHQARDVVQRCQEYGLQVTFNMFSPTKSYKNNLATGAEKGSNKFFNVSSQDDNLLWKPDSLIEKHRVVSRIMEEFPNTVAYSEPYNDWVTQPGPLFDIDPVSGIARDCKSRVGPALKLFNTNMEEADVKCCTSEIDCNTCRMYSGGLATRLRPSIKDISSRHAFERYLKISKHLFKIYVYEPNWVNEE